ncbi:hypothetical protein B0H16DRAFT_1547985, partial [Mycena metata]
MAEMWIWRTSSVFIAVYLVLTFLAAFGACQAPHNDIARAALRSFYDGWLCGLHLMPTLPYHPILHHTAGTSPEDFCGCQLEQVHSP